MTRKRIATWSVALLLAAAVSCKRETTVSQPSAADDIRGQPINSPTASNVVKPSSPPDAVAAQKPRTAPAAALTADIPQNPDEPLTVGFDKLASFTYDVPIEQPATNAPPTASQIPAAIKAYDKKKVALKGFMLPLKVEGGLVTELLIMRDQSMCCYGTVPKINEWVSVKMATKGVKPIMDQPVTMFGTLHVGEMRENGYLVGIYALDGEKMAGPLDL